MIVRPCWALSGEEGGQTLIPVSLGIQDQKEALLPFLSGALGSAGDEACHTMAWRKQSGNGWMVYQKRRSPNNSLVCWTLWREREETRAKSTLPRGPDQRRQVGPCNGRPPVPRVTNMRQGGRGAAQTTTFCPVL